MSDNEGVETPSDGDREAPPGVDTEAPTDDAATPSPSDAGVEGDGGAESDGDGDRSDDGESESTTDDELVDRVADQPPEDVAGEIRALRERVDDLEADLASERATAEELESKLTRKQADFQNYKKRQQKKLEDQQRRATESLVERLLDVRDNLVRALDQDEGADIRDGVEATLRQFDQVMAAESVEAIEPDPGAEVDPVRHEVLMQVESDQPGGTVADIHRPGYEMAGKVLRPAQVTVAEE